ncbi:transcriptional repressor, partial [Paratractidigestivibacter faecalis]
MAGRNTVQREIILEELRGLANHPTADEVYESVHAKHPSISKATVYRI